MADDVTVGGVVYATDDLGGRQAQLIKLLFGADGVGTMVQQSAGLPVNLVNSGGSGTTTTGNLTAAGVATLAGATSTTGAVVIDVGSAGNVSFHLLATAFVGTVVFEQSFDPAGANGTWAAVPLLPEDSTSAPMTTLAINTAVAYVRQFTTGMLGPKLFRVRASAFTSGSLTVLGSAGPGWLETQPALAPSLSTIGHLNELRASTTVVSATGAAAIATATLPAPGAGLYHYITAIHISRYMTAAGTANGTRQVTGGTNHGLIFTLPNEVNAQGLQSVPVDFRPTTPLRVAAANTATTVTTPAITNTTYQINVTYFVAP